MYQEMKTKFSDIIEKEKIINGIFLKAAHFRIKNTGGRGKLKFIPLLNAIDL